MSKPHKKISGDYMYLPPPPSKCTPYSVLKIMYEFSFVHAHMTYVSFAGDKTIIILKIISESLLYMYVPV